MIVVIAIIIVIKIKTILIIVISYDNVRLEMIVIGTLKHYLLLILVININITNNSSLTYLLRIYPKLNLEFPLKQLLSKLILYSIYIMNTNNNIVMYGYYNI